MPGVIPPWITSVVALREMRVAAVLLEVASDRDLATKTGWMKETNEGPGAGTGSCGLVQIEAVGIPSLLPETTDLVVRKRDKTDQRHRQT